MDENKTVSLEELELLLEEKDLAIEIKQDGSIKTVKGAPSHAKPKIFTLKQALSGTY